MVTDNGRQILHMDSLISCMSGESAAEAPVILLGVSCKKRTLLALMLFILSVRPGGSSTKTALSLAVAHPALGRSQLNCQARNTGDLPWSRSHLHYNFFCFLEKHLK